MAHSTTQKIQKKHPRPTPLPWLVHPKPYPLQLYPPNPTSQHNSQYDPDFECSTLLIFKQTINVPFHEFVTKTNMDISTTPKRRDDISHVPIPQAEEAEHDNEKSILLTPPPSTIRPILKYNSNSTPTVYQSPQKPPPTTNEIRVAMTSSPTSPQSPELSQPNPTERQQSRGQHRDNLTYNNPSNLSNQA